jgi:endonuclease/exonuclease/phosphatase family metal-dependent hydrolase
VPRRAARAALLAALTALLLGLFAPVPAASDGPGLRVMTWNVETADFDPDDWVGVVADQHPDVVGFQEICVGEAQRLAGLLRDRYGLDYAVAVGGARVSHYPGCDPPGTDPLVVFGQALLSRLPVRDAATTFLPDGGGVDEPRTCLSVTIDPPGGPVRILTTHLTIGPGAEEDAVTAARRTALQAQQADTVAQEAARSGSRVLVIGDLNMPPDDPRLAVMARAGLTEVDRGRDSPTSNNNVEVPGAAADRKLDYVFQKGLPPTGDPRTSWVAGSDHRPLVATVRL